MKRLLISNGATMFRKYVLDHKRAHDMVGIHKKTMRKKDENGEVYWEKTYYYQKVERSDAEKSLKIAEGHNPKGTTANFKDMYLGDAPPKGYEEDALSLLKENNEVKFKGKDLICDEATFEAILKIAPNYFEDLPVYVLN